MTVSELMPTPLTDLAQEQDALFMAGATYPFWSQYVAYEAAETLQAALVVARQYTFEVQPKR